MITRIDNINNRPNFQANIVFNETLYKSLAKAKTDIRMWDSNYTPVSQKRQVNDFVEALNHILKDGTKDVYEVRPGNLAYEPQNRCWLFKNGQKVKYHDNSNASLAENVMDIIIKTALDNDLYKEFYLNFKNIKTKINNKQLTKNIDNIMSDKHFGEML